MDKLRRSFRSSFRRRKEPITTVSEAAKPHLWQTDEKDVRAGNCLFQVKYLGCVEVFESRGIQVCEEALRVLKNSRRRPVRAILHVSGDGLRVVEDDTKGLIVDQTIEKVSFCAPDRTHDRGFSYICRDGTTRRWMCHGFLAMKESGERLSHAVGCSFAVCLERKQKRNKECTVTMNFDLSNSTFTRTDSFLQQSLTEKLQDTSNKNNNVDTTIIQETVTSLTNCAIPAEIVDININANYNNRKGNEPMKTTSTASKVQTQAIERPHATMSMLQRQGSFCALSHLNQASPFKRQLSLRPGDLPLTQTERSRSHSMELTLDSRTHSAQVSSKSAVNSIPESSPVHNDDGNTTPETVTDQVSMMCQQLSQNLSMLSKNDDLLGSKSDQVNTNQCLSFKDLFTQKVIECSSQLRELQPVYDTNSLLYTQKSCSDSSKTSNELSQSQDSTLQNTDCYLTNNNLLGDVNVINAVPLTPPATPSLSTNTWLPKPDQWLGKVAQLTLKEASALTLAPATLSPPICKRSPALALHTRAYSLNSAEVMNRASKEERAADDSFNIDWSSLAIDLTPQSKSTNPFLSS